MKETLNAVKEVKLKSLFLRLKIIKLSDAEGFTHYNIKLMVLCKDTMQDWLQKAILKHTKLIILKLLN